MLMSDLLSSSRATGELVDVGLDYEKALAEETAKLQRLYGGGDLTSFPEFKFTGKFMASDRKLLELPSNFFFYALPKR